MNVLYVFVSYVSCSFLLSCLFRRRMNGSGGQYKFMSDIMQFGGLVGCE